MFKKGFPWWLKWQRICLQHRRWGFKPWVRKIPRRRKSESEVAQSCMTLRDPMDCNPPDSSIHGIFQARVLEWVAIAFSADMTESAFIYYTPVIPSPQVKSWVTYLSPPKFFFLFVYFSFLWWEHLNEIYLLTQYTQYQIEIVESAFNSGSLERA